MSLLPLNEIIVFLVGCLVYRHAYLVWTIMNHHVFWITSLVVMAIYAIFDYYIGVGRDWRQVQWLRSWVIVCEWRLKLCTFQYLRYLLDDTLKIVTFPNEVKILKEVQNNDEWMMYASAEMMRDKKFCESAILAWSASIVLMDVSALCQDRNLALRLLSHHAHMFEYIPTSLKKDKQFVIHACIANRILYSMMSIMHQEEYLPNIDDLNTEIACINRSIDD